MIVIFTFLHYLLQVLGALILTTNHGYSLLCGKHKSVWGGQNPQVLTGSQHTLELDESAY